MSEKIKDLPDDYNDRKKHYTEVVMPWIEALYSIHNELHHGKLVIRGNKITITVTPSNPWEDFENDRR